MFAVEKEKIIFNDEKSGEIMIVAMNHITLAVKNIDKSFLFYRDVLGLKPIVKWDKGAYFFVGEPTKNLLASGFWFCLNTDEKRISNLCFTHYAFTVPEDKFDEMADKIIASGCKIFQENRTPGKSLYFLDPDEHKLEIHVGTAEMRIAVKKADPGKWKNVQWFV